MEEKYSALDSERIKELAIAVVKQVRTDYVKYKSPNHPNYISDKQLDNFGRFCWVWEALDVDGKVISDGIKKNGRNYKYPKHVHDRQL